MSSKPRFHWLEPIKTMLIVLLVASAGYLLTRTSLPGSPGSFLSSLGSLIPGTVSPSPGTAEEQGSFVRPVRMVVTNDKPGRYGIQYDQETLDAKFGGALLNLISDALSGADVPKPVSARVWLAALAPSARPGLYLDFPGSVPCRDLAVWLGGRASNPKLTGNARQLLLTLDDKGAAILYYSNEGDGSYYACKTSPDLADRLTAAVAEFEPNGAHFAFEDEEQYAGLAPETLILSQITPQKVYSVSNPIPSGSDAVRTLIQRLTFHPQSGAVTLDDVPIREGADTLRISTTGVVSYYSASAEDIRFPVGQGSANPSRTEMATAAWELLDACITGSMGEARLYLAGFVEEEGGVVAYFGYQLGGISVQVGGDGYAARVVFEGRRISAFTLQLRRYEDAGSTSIVLPEVQAAAAMEALDVSGSELTLCYLDQGGEVRAGWIAT